MIQNALEKIVRPAKCRIFPSAPVFRLDELFLALMIDLRMIGVLNECSPYESAFSYARPGKRRCDIRK